MQKSLSLTHGAAMLMIAAAVIAVAFVAGGVVGAQEPSKAPCQAMRPGEGGPTISSVNTVDNTLTLNFANEEKEATTLSYSDDTKIVKNGKEATENDLAIGDKVHFRGDRQNATIKAIFAADASFEPAFSGEAGPGSAWHPGRFMNRMRHHFQGRGEAGFDTQAQGRFQAPPTDAKVQAQGGGILGFDLL